MNIKDSNVIITGASSGIGRELLILLLDAGARVVAASRSMEDNTFEHKNLFKKNCDVSDKADLDQLFAFALEKLGDIDLFVANAGFAYYEKLGEPDWDHIRQIFATNTTGLFYAAQMMKKIKGSKPYNFICTASAMSFLSIPGYALYSSTKAAIRGFADAYRFELEQGQYFQVAFPVATKTNFFKAAGDNPPVPWPTQSARDVALAMFRGIEKNQLNIFPSGVFRLTSALNRFIPLINYIYVHRENTKLHDWLAKEESDRS
jgi:uncharacterized protein